MKCQYSTVCMSVWGGPSCSSICLREGAREWRKSILRHVLSHSHCVFSSSFVWPLSGFVFVTVVDVTWVCYRKADKKYYFFSLGLQYSWFFCCLRSPYPILPPYFSCQSLLLSCSLSLCWAISVSNLDII